MGIGMSYLLYVLIPLNRVVLLNIKERILKQQAFMVLIPLNRVVLLNLSTQHSHFLLAKES